MTLLKVLTDDHPILRKKSQPINKITPEIKKLAHDMLETMRSKSGVGLAAPQVGLNINLIVLEAPKNPQDPDAPGFPLYMVINPQIIPACANKTTGTEGCLSVPGWYGPVPRFDRIKVTGLDLKGKKINLTVDGFAARVFQHETDHLAGIIFTDYIDDPTQLKYIDPTGEQDEEK